MNNQPIGFLDSGVGGLTVVKEVMKLLPGEEIYYIGDSARNPYGSRPVDEVRTFTFQLAHFLIKHGIKLLVVACNTATVAALDFLQKEMPIPVIGVIEAGSKAAAKNTKNQIIGIIGTEGTIRSNEYEKQITEHLAQAQLQSVACPRLVSIVEKFQYQSSPAKQVVVDELKLFEGSQMDTLVLGCTHYPLLQKYIQEYLGDEVKLIDPGVETAKQVKNYLKENNLLNEKKTDDITHTFFTTGASRVFEDIASNWLEESHFTVKHLSIEELQQ